MRSRFALGFLAAVVAVSATACSSSSDPAAGDGGRAPGPSALSSAKGQVTVTIWDGLSGPAATAFAGLVDQFNRENAGKIRVKTAFQGDYADVQAKYAAAIRSKSTPTLLLASQQAIGFMADSKVAVSAAAMAAANPGVVDIDHLSPMGKSYYTLGGKLLAVPFNMSAPMLYVNRAVLAKDGVPASTPLSSFADVVAAAKTVHQHDNSMPGLGVDFDPWYIQQLAASFGEAFCTPDNARAGKPATSLNLAAPNTKATLITLNDLYHSGVIPNSGGNNAVNLFNAGKVAMMFNTSGRISVVQKAATFDWQALPFPVTGPKNSSGTFLGGSAFYLANAGHGDAEKVAAWKAIGFLTNPQSQATLSRATGYAPVNIQTASVASYKMFLAKTPAQQNLLDQVNSTPNSPIAAGCASGALTQVQTDFMNALQAAFTGSTSLNSAISKANASARKDFSEYREQVGR